MGLRNTRLEYGSVAKALHWLVAIALFALIILGVLQDEMDKGDARSSVRFIHASIASVTFMLMTLRILWRFINDVPVHPEGTPAWQNLGASLVHWGLYLTVFMQLVAGAIMTATGGKEIPVFRLFSMTLPIGENHDAHEWWEEVHEYAWIPIAILIAIHVLGALYNHFVEKNDVLRRMTVGVK